VAGFELTFATYNIHKSVGLDRRRNPERILSVLREIDADIIALQEADRRFGQRVSTIPRALLDDSPWHALDVTKRPRSIGWHGNALLARRSLNVLAARPLGLPMLEPRGAALARFDIGGVEFQVVGTHLDLSGARRADQVRAIEKALAKDSKPLPSIVMGDFNHWGRSNGAMREFNNNSVICAPGATFPSRRPIARLDRIVASEHFTVISTDVHHSRLAAQASDHLPVWAKLAIA